MNTKNRKQIPEDIGEAVKALQPWFHNIHLPDGTQTAPQHPLGDFPSYKWEKIAPHLPQDLTGWRVLEIGCNAGYYTVALAQRGAHVVGIDINPHYLCQAEWVVKQFGLSDRIELRRQQIYDLAHDDEMFDLVFFMGVLYHLRYPLLGLDIITQKTQRLLVFQTLMTPSEEVGEPVYDLKLVERDRLEEPTWPKLAFIEHAFCKDFTNWWVANKAAALAMLRASGMKLISELDPEIFLCEPDSEHPSAMTTWNRAEFLSATGQPWKKAPQPFKNGGMQTHPQKVERQSA